MSFHCAQHVDVAARGTCERCGRFCCHECLAAEDLCRECNARAVAELPSLETLALPTSISMALTSLLIASTVVFNRVDAMVHFDPSHVITGLGMLGSVVGLVISAALFLAWFYRATTHALLRHLTLTVASPTEAIGSWFTPAKNVWTPYEVLRRMRRGTGGGTGLVNAWQAMNLATALLLIPAHLSALSPAAASAYFSVSMLTLSLGGLLGARVVHGIRWPR